jgi:thiamine kinase-like enzyme
MSERDVRALPFWKGAIEVELLSGGLTNVNYRVVCQGDAFAVRFGRDDPLLGIDRRNELACTRAAADLGIAPRIAYVGEGALVSEFVAGRPLDPGAVKAQMDRVAATVRVIHDAGAGITGHLMWFSPFLVARTYVRSAAANGLRLPAGVEPKELLAQVADLERRIAPFRPTFCHNDMMPGNFLDDGQRIHVIDWEYSGFGHPLFDLAGLSSNCEFDAAQDLELLRTYGAGPGDAAQLGVMKAMAALRESLWAVLQGAQSAIEFDYDGYRDDNYRKFVTYRSAVQ